MADTRTSAILLAVTKQLNERRPALDRADDLAELVVTVRFLVGGAIKSVIVSEEHIHRRTHEV